MQTKLAQDNGWNETEMSRQTGGKKGSEFFFQKLMN